MCYGAPALPLLPCATCLLESRSLSAGCEVATDPPPGSLGHTGVGRGLCAGLHS